MQRRMVQARSKESKHKPKAHWPRTQTMGIGQDVHVSMGIWVEQVLISNCIFTLWGLALWCNIGEKARNIMHIYRKNALGMIILEILMLFGWREWKPLWLYCQLNTNHSQSLYLSRRMNPQSIKLYFHFAVFQGWEVGGSSYREGDFLLWFEVDWTKGPHATPYSFIRWW